MASARPDLLVALGLVLHDGRVLLTKRHEEDAPDLHEKWELPGGKVEKDEAAEAAAVRELSEETGYACTADRLLPVAYEHVVMNGNGTRHVTVVCVLCSLTNEVALRGPWERDPKIAAVEWMRPQEIPYMSMLPGSRDFVWHACRRLGIPLATDDPLNHTYLELQRVAWTENTKKRYQLTLRLRPTSDEPHIVTRVWGRLGAATRSHTETFSDFSSAKRAFLSHARTRLKHGYAITDFDEDTFPDKVWLSQVKDRVAPDAQAQMRLEL